MTEHEMETYLKKSGVNVILRSMVAQLCINKPEKPVEFMIEFLQNNYAAKESQGVRAAHATSELAAADCDKAEADDMPVNRSKRSRRGGFSSETMKDVNLDAEPIAVVPKSEGAKQRLKEALLRNILFSHLDDEEREDIFNAMFEVDFEQNAVIIKQGDVGDHFYVVESGECDIFVTNSAGQRAHVQHVDVGGSFGELALIYGTLRAADVIATTVVKCWVIDRIAYRRILMGATLRKREQYKVFLSKVPILESLTDYERLVVADALEAANFPTGEVVVQQGEMGDIFYLIMEGEARVSKRDDAGNEEEVGYLRASDYFGEIALLTNRPRAATVTAASPLRCVKLDRERFIRVLGPCDVILRRNMANYNKYMQLA